MANTAVLAGRSPYDSGVKLIPAKLGDRTCLADSGESVSFTVFRGTRQPSLLMKSVTA